MITIQFSHLKTVLFRKLPCLLVFYALANTLVAGSPWLYFNSFDKGMDADFSKGNPRGISCGRSEAVETEDKERGKVLSVPFSDHFCLELKENLSFEEGTISLDVQARFSLSELRSGYGKTQCLLNTEIRPGTKLSLRVEISGGRASLVLETAADRKGKPSRLVFDVSGWKQGEWHRIAAAWKQPGMLALIVDGEEKEISNGNIPNLPSAMMYDLFVGTNSQGTSGYGDTQHADFHFDNLAIFSVYKYMPQAGEVPPAREKLLVPADVTGDPEWIGINRQRINFYTGLTHEDWNQAPVRVNLDFGEEWDQLDGAGKRAALDSMRLVEYDPVSGRALVQDESREGEEKYFVPFRASPELYWQSEGSVSWVRRGNRMAAYSLYYDYSAPYAHPFPRSVPMTGDGDRLQLGLKGDANRISLGIAGSFELHDPRGDGQWSIWANIGTGVFPRSRDLGYGLYYFERLPDDGRGTVYAPAQLIYKGSTPFHGLTIGNNMPNLADINGDGKLEYVYSGNKAQEWWQFEMKNGKPVITSQNQLKFKDEPLKGETKSVVYDYNGDGLPDLQLGRRVYLNIGSRESALFDTENPVDLEMENPVVFGEPYLFYADVSNEVDESIPREWFFFPIDWDGDGKRDLVTASFFPYIYFRKNVGSNEVPRYADRVRLTTFAHEELHVVTMLTYVRIVDWDGDGDMDLVFGGEDGCIGVCENIAGPGHEPQLAQTVFIKQENAPMDAGSLAIPMTVDWDDDGDLDLIVGNSAGHILFFENSGTTENPVWEAGLSMMADGVAICLLPGKDGSVQGPKENFWGYANPIVVDWDGDGLKDLIVSGNRMTHHFFKNIGRKGAPRLAAGKLIQLKNPPRDEKGKRSDLPWGLRYEPQGNELITVHRSRAQAIDWNGDGVMDLVALDHKGELALYLGERNEKGEVVLGNAQNIFEIDGPYARGIVWNRPTPEDGKLYPGSFGRTVLKVIDWNGDGLYDLLYDNINARFYENIGDNEHPRLVDRGDLVQERLANHNAGIDAVDFDGDGKLDLLVGGESGHVYYFHRSYIEGDIPEVLLVSRQKR